MAPVESQNRHLTRRSTVGLRGFRLNPAVLTYAMSSLPARPPRRLRRRRERRIRKRLEAETIERLVAEYVTGTTAAELGRLYGIAKSSVLGLVRQAREQVRHPRLSTTQTALLVALYEAGLSQVDIAERLGRSPSAVWHCLRRLGFVGSPPVCKRLAPRHD
jgi:DNA-directed RNA polymerase specialized sigma24 family protein